ncbi:MULTISPECIES: DUF1648 domain-containing protein [unclassified Curtobacterium]|uniref:DUF1648 domain-containing protein n=1 Tax=unclassified Curtobacterium TaxID=257496 RepID=UPI00381E81C2
MTTPGHSHDVAEARGGGPTVRSPALVVAAVMAWVPAAVLVVVRILWTGVPARVPTHWSGAGVVDGWGSSTFAFWSMLVPGAVGAFICSVLAVTLATDTTKVKAALALGIVTAVTGGIASAWFTMVLTAIGSAVALLPVAGAIVWGALTFVVCLLRRDPTG